ncbi:MAG: hypothetical protein Q7S57_01210 [bacterium]|nr:hypothetical protein [bacterium]
MADKSSLTLTIMFFLFLELLTVRLDYYWGYFALFCILLILGTVLTQREDVKERGLYVTILPLAYIASVFLFNLFVSQGLFQQVFIIASTVGFFFLVARGIEWAFPTWNWFFTSVTFFLITAGAYGLRFHLQISLAVVLLLVGASTFLLSLHVLGRAKLSRSGVFFWSILLALLMCEFLGVFSFLPLSYLVVSGALFIIFYVAIHLLQSHIYATLTLKLATEYLLFATVAITLILGTARWAVI